MKFHRMDHFLIENMLAGKQQIGVETTSEEREKAYAIFLEKCGAVLPASERTMKRWFGIGEFHKPNRRQLIQIFFSLSLPCDVARKWLTEGALEPDFQINDLNEFFYLYGLQNRMSYEECETMIQQFLQKCNPKLRPEQHHQTGELWEGYEQNCALSREEFMAYALSIQTKFKGYSRTVLEYFNDLREEIVYLKGREHEMRMDELLSETNYFSWLSEKKVKTGHNRKTIRKYIKHCEKHKVLSEGMLNQIKENLIILNRSAKANTQWLAELFPSRNELNIGKDKRLARGDVRVMDDKYISEILNIAAQKEKEMQLLLARAPKKALREQQKRCRIIDRHDLLPLIYLVVQKRQDIAYSTRGSMDGYFDNQEHKEFVELANQILTACNMPAFHPERYELDYWIDRCFDEDNGMMYYEMLIRYSYGEV